MWEERWGRRFQTERRAETLRFVGCEEQKEVQCDWTQRGRAVGGTREATQLGGGGCHRLPRSLDFTKVPQEVTRGHPRRSNTAVVFQRPLNCSVAVLQNPISFIKHGGVVPFLR